MVKEERTLSKDLSFGYKTKVYQIESKYKHRLSGKKVHIYESHGEIKMVLQNGKKLAYHKWQERVAEPTEVVEVKELETRWPTIKKTPSRKHPWRR